MPRLLLFGGPQSYWVETEHGDELGIVFWNDQNLWSAREEKTRANHGDWYTSAWNAAKQLQLGLSRSYAP